VVPGTATAPAAPADPQARSAVARETARRHARTVSAAVVLRHDLDVLVTLTSLPIAVFDAQVGEMHLVIEVREVVLVCPFADLVDRPIWVAVVVRAVTIALVQSGLILALELVVEDHPFDLRITRRQPLCGAFVRTIDLEVVFEFPLAFQAMPERLAVTLVAVTMVFEKASAFPGQRHRMFA
jgi:hypothetical protein